MEMEIDPPRRPNRDFKPQDLFKAAETGDSSAFTSLSKEELSKSLSLRNEDGRSLLHVAASSGQLEVRLLLPSFTVFLFACSENAVVKVLAASDEASSVVNSADEEGWAPLHSAASIGNSEIVDILLSKGADVNLKNDGGRTALHYAASKGWLKIAEILISHRAKINLKDKASSTGNSELCELLIEEGADVDAVDKAGQTPLMNAVICYNKEVSLLLIRHGADVDVEDKEGYTVLGRASNDFRPILVDAAKAMLEG
ncbi:26S proteasome non-ATPase regulatory subunit 10 [Morus notabilis]|uniref:26S proteasome non-ATPase regulatory subunit 10 n=1 Tax=Morus notabilis TaxID=981085 RepID=W9RCP0_9ROSA|nr:26S proteasome non-ATPase regulatory subunit 10 [Morus notabilis]